MIHPGSYNPDVTVIPLTIEGQTCEITLRRGAMASLRTWIAERVGDVPTLVVTDTTVAALPVVAGLVDVAIPPGESSKSMPVLSMLYDALSAASIPRDGVVVALGGGVVSDVAGFAAATWLRGLRWLVIPTSLLSMVDAAIGGKVALNWGAAKNQVGAFHQPSAVLIDPEVQATLPEREYLSGVGEILKTSCLDADFFPWLEARWMRLLARDPQVLDEAISRCARIKAAIVATDPTEQGVRRQLNLGHTMGHAYEAYWAGRVPHGLCIALGVMIEAGIGRTLGVTDPVYATRIAALATELLALPASDFPEGPPPSLAELAPLLEADKKRLPSGLIRWQIPVRPGVVEEHLIRGEGTGSAGGAAEAEAPEPKG